MLGPDFSEFVALLAEHEVRCLIVGGYAVAFHGHPRYTGAIDVWVERSPEDAALVYSLPSEPRGTGVRERRSDLHRLWRPPY